MRWARRINKKEPELGVGAITPGLWGAVKTL
jgi:hypothetical protein